MFKKPDTGKTPDVLASRLKAIAAKPALEQAEYTTLNLKNGRAPRNATFKQATLTLSGGERFDVVMKNISDSGARVEFFSKGVLSEYVTISEPTLRLKLRARIMWQTDGAAGLQFIRE
jgi:hypothetical protein